MRYRKKPVEVEVEVEVEAIQWVDNTEEIINFCDKNIMVYNVFDTAWKVGMAPVCKRLIIHTLEGDMTASRYDYIIKGVNGEFYLCKPDIFEKTYELVEEAK